MNMIPLSDQQYSATDQSLLEFEYSTNDHAWLVSYLDIFILTAALFATLLTFEQQMGEDQNRAPDQQTIGKSSFANNAEQAYSSFVYPLANSHTETILAHAGNIDHFVPALKPFPFQQDRWQNSTVIALQRHAFDDRIDIQFSKGYAEMSIGSAVLFEVSDARLLDRGTLLLKDVVGFLKETEGLIVVQGHTDSSPISSERYPSNWELASARANNVLHFLLANGLERRRLRAVSFADTRPALPNNSEANRRQNRRVNIVLISPAMSEMEYHNL